MVSGVWWDLVDHPPLLVDGDLVAPVGLTAPPFKQMNLLLPFPSPFPIRPALLAAVQEAKMQKRQRPAAAPRVS